MLQRQSVKASEVNIRMFGSGPNVGILLTTNIKIELRTSAEIEFRNTSAVFVLQKLLV